MQKVNYMKSSLLCKLLVSSTLTLFALPSLAKSCTVYYDSGSGTGSRIYDADNEIQAQAKFKKEYPDRRITNIVCR